MHARLSHLHVQCMQLHREHAFSHWTNIVVLMSHCLVFLPHIPQHASSFDNSISSSNSSIVATASSPTPPALFKSPEAILSDLILEFPDPSIEDPSPWIWNAICRRIPESLQIPAETKGACIALTVHFVHQENRPLPFTPAAISWSCWRPIKTLHKSESCRWFRLHSGCKPWHCLKRKISTISQLLQIWSKCQSL